MLLHTTKHFKKSAFLKIYFCTHGDQIMNCKKMFLKKEKKKRKTKTKNEKKKKNSNCNKKTRHNFRGE